MRELRQKVNDELHARPDMRLGAPAQCFHFLLRYDQKTPYDRDSVMAKFCSEESLTPPNADARFFITKSNDLTVKWEAHTESNSYTIAGPIQGEPFSGSPSDFLPDGLVLQDAPDLVTGVHIVALKQDDLDGVKSYDYAKSVFKQVPIVGGSMSGGYATVWTSYVPDDNGMIKFLIVTDDISEGRLGRLIQRLLDIEGYRMKAMMALPEAHRVMQALNEQEPLLDDIMERLASSPTEAEQESLLSEITRVAANVEHVVTQSAYRFSAAKAYAAIVAQRLQDVSEETKDGHERIGKFLKKRLNPAMRTCQAAEERAKALAKRVTRAANLLNTMVDFVNKKQNQSILKSMEQRARMQVMLQMAVEGLSIVAISYYGTGLFSYLLKSIKAMGVKVDVDLLTGFAIPGIALITWVGVHWAKRGLKKIK